MRVGVELRFEASFGQRALDLRIRRIQPGRFFEGADRGLPFPRLQVLQAFKVPRIVSVAARLVAETTRILSEAARLVSEAAQRLAPLPSVPPSSSMLIAVPHILTAGDARHRSPSSAGCP